MNGRKPVCDHKHRAARHQLVHTVLHNALGAGINRACGFVQDQHGRVGHSGARNGQQLALALAELAAIPLQHGVVAVRQAFDKLIGVGQLGGCNAFLIGSIQLAVADIFHHSAGKQMGVLQHNAKASAQIGLFDLLNVNAIIQDRALLNIVKTIDQVGNGGFACARAAYKGDFLAGLGKNVNIMQNGFFRRIAKIHPVEAHISGQRHIAHAAIGIVLLPCPVVGFLLAFGHAAVCIQLHIAQLHRALVLLGLFVQQIENTLGARQCHNNAVDLLRHLTNGLVEAAVILQKAGKAAQRKAADAVDGQHCARHGADHIAQIAKVHVDGAQHIAVAVGFVGTFVQLLVERIKVFNAFLLVAEHLDHLLPFDHFFDIAVQLAQILLLLDKVIARAAGQQLGAPHHAEHDAQVQDGERDAENDHAYQNADNGERAGKHLRQALAQQLAKRIHIVGVQRHHLAVGVCVKIRNGQRLHVRKHTVTNRFQRALAHIDHDAVIGIRAACTHQIKACHPQDRQGQRAKIRVLGADHGQNVIIDQGFHKHGALQIGISADQNAGCHQNAMRQIIFKHHTHQAVDDLFRVLQFRFGAAAMPSHRAAGHTIIRHYPAPLSAENNILPDKFCCCAAAPRGCPRHPCSHGSSPQYGRHPARC